MHAVTRDCPLTCLELLLPAAAYNALRHGCPSSPHPTAGDAADLHAAGKLAGIRNVGPARSRHIETALIRAG